ncbi:MAG: winged helix-turn-helix transcriptional regulator, partial [Candidatus Hermodarchaeota archaeon]
MDEIDLLIIRKLLENSRITYRELAEIINLSVSAVHKRIKALEDDGVITAYIARPSVIALKCLFVVVYGTSKAKVMGLVRKILGQHENINEVAILGSKYFFISAYLRDISELQEFSSYVSKTAQISEPLIGILNVPYITIPETLINTDFKILKYLNRDARKPITDVADDTGLSSKTVRKRIDNMIKNKLVSFTIEWKPLSTQSFFSIFFIYLNEGTNMNNTFRQLSKKYSKNIAYMINYSNIPNFINMITWAK